MKKRKWKQKLEVKKKAPKLKNFKLHARKNIMVYYESLTYSQHQLGRTDSFACLLYLGSYFERQEESLKRTSAQSESDPVYNIEIPPDPDKLDLFGHGPSALSPRHPVGR